MQLIYLEKIIHLRHTLHQHPDLSMRESGTIRFLQNFLRENTSLEIHEREEQIPDKTGIRTAFVNIGMIIFAVITIGMITLSLLSAANT